MARTKIERDFNRYEGAQRSPTGSENGEETQVAPKPKTLCAEAASLEKRIRRASTDPKALGGLQILVVSSVRRGMINRAEGAYLQSVINDYAGQV